MRDSQQAPNTPEVAQPYLSMSKLLRLNTPESAPSHQEQLNTPKYAPHPLSLGMTAFWPTQIREEKQHKPKLFGPDFCGHS